MQQESDTTHVVGRGSLLRFEGDTEISCCLLSYFRTSRIVLAITLFIALVSTAAAFTNGQPASLVLGQSNFTSSGYPTTASGMFIPQGVAIDPVSGKVFIADGDNNRVLRFDNVDSKTNGAAADGVLGQPDFTSSNAFVVGVR